MAHFYGKVTGQRGQATRLGGVKSGLETVAASWDGAVKTRLYDVEGETMVCIETIPWQGNGEYREVYRGPLSKLFKCLAIQAVHSNETGHVILK